ncbi:GAF domain-containing protein [Actinomadura graeca]|uniref:GAF domain-containing protein n=1 Tax=Actinomadura graeca TaxID=2750812 RepID=A0ABX8QW20_9ACTN|nr:GAF domain-containing protein [Actinomadura graeca]QXJ22556.1 GAF domain-containing protein [Actinomadura graeca]
MTGNDMGPGDPTVVVPPMTGLGETEVLGMLNVSRAVVSGGSESIVLDQIAREAAKVAHAGAARILLSGGRHGFRVASNYGIGEVWARRLDRMREEAEIGPAGIAVRHGVPIAIDDHRTHPMFRPWCEAALAAGFGAMLLVPMKVDDRCIGAMAILRAARGPWPRAQIDVLCLFAAHAASTIRIAQLVEGQARRLSALDRAVDGLRAQAHEHANRLQAVAGLLALGDVDAAMRFVDGLTAVYVMENDQITSRIEVRVVAGLLIAEGNIARQRGVTLELAEDSTLTHLPSRLSDADVVTILGNLIDNAVASILVLPQRERVVTVRICAGAEELLVEVSNPLPPGMSLDRERMFERGYTTKGGHAGLGLALVAQAVNAAFGVIDVVAGEAMTIRVAIPYD